MKEIGVSAVLVCEICESHPGDYCANVRARNLEGPELLDLRSTDLLDLQIY